LHLAALTKHDGDAGRMGCHTEFNDAKRLIDCLRRRWKQLRLVSRQ
jgi:hypothetical protein